MTYAQFISDILGKRGRVLTGVHKERHHILPKSLGGSNDKDNLIDLLPEEHFIAHQLLAQEHPESKAMKYAMRRMSNMWRIDGVKLISTPEEYREARLAIKERGRTTSFGKQRREETKRKISEANKGKKRSPECVKALKERLAKYYQTHQSPAKGKSFSDEHKRKLCEAHKRRTSYYAREHTLTPEEKAQRVAKFKETYWAKPAEVRKEQTRKAVQNRASARYWQGKEVPQEMRDKISETLKRKHLCPPHAIAVYCLETDTVYRSFTEAEQHLGVDRHIIKRYVDGKRKDEKYHFSIVEKPE